MSDVLVLCYHAVSDSWPAPLSVTPSALHDQVQRLVRRGYRPRCFSDAVLDPVAGRTLVVTFDDAFASVHAQALPVLRGLGIPATVFVPTGHVGGGPMQWPGIDGWADGPHSNELTGCTWEQIAELRQERWEVGSHSHSHQRLTTLTDEDLRIELRDSKTKCETRTGVACRSLAYPYGDHDARVVAAAQDAGYLAACTLPVRTHAAAALRFPRVYVSHADGGLRFAAKTSPSMRLLRRSPAWSGAAALRSALGH